jgi:hypothetical protein
VNIGVVQTFEEPSGARYRIPNEEHKRTQKVQALTRQYRKPFGAVKMCLFMSWRIFVQIFITSGMKYTNQRNHSSRDHVDNEKNTRSNMMIIDIDRNKLFGMNAGEADARDAGDGDKITMTDRCRMSTMRTDGREMLGLAFKMTDHFGGVEKNT